MNILLSILNFVTNPSPLTSIKKISYLALFIGIPIPSNIFTSLSASSIVGL
ncbi:Uncharacterised protein [Chryseobacterium carnipullorum]|uniref:Uncharacterized protein n=1 Tax=Chryseobacterium carnipullorum TaxID=1124835 RepID=A0A376EP76_CHRCU|nr:Uncharacterised protein [Chryseobacterium carnipullorum]